MKLVIQSNGKVRLLALKEVVMGLVIEGRITAAKSAKLPTSGARNSPLFLSQRSKFLYVTNINKAVDDNHIKGYVSNGTLLNSSQHYKPTCMLNDGTQELLKALHQVEEVNRNLSTEIQERKKVEEKLKATRNLYDAMAHNFPAGWIGVLDKELRYVLVDGETLSKLGWDPKKLIGQKITDMLKLPASYELEKHLNMAMQGVKIKFSFKYRDRNYTIYGVPLPGNSDSEILVVVRDVTERVQFEEGLQKALEKEKELGELKSRFVTMASHEFRTPLTTIQSSAYLLEHYTGEKLEAEKATHLGRIKRSAKVLTEILNDFLSLGKIEEGKVKPSIDEFQFNEFMTDLVSELESLKRGNQRIVFHHKGDDTIFSDKQLLRNIINNLVSNALKYTHNDDQIEIESESKEGELIIHVVDHGIGIPEEERKHIFKRFFRARNATNIQGTGLGLNIVKKYTRLLRGSVAYESKVNVGSSFTVTLPTRENALIKTQKL